MSEETTALASSFVNGTYELCERKDERLRVTLNAFVAYKRRQTNLKKHEPEWTTNLNTFNYVKNKCAAKHFYVELFT